MKGRERQPPTTVTIVLLSSIRSFGSLIALAGGAFSGGLSDDDLDDGVGPRRKLYGWLYRGRRCKRFKRLAKRAGTWGNPDRPLFVIGRSGRALIARNGWVYEPVEVLGQYARGPWTVLDVHFTEVAERAFLIYRTRWSSQNLQS